MIRLKNGHLLDEKGIISISSIHEDFIGYCEPEEDCEEDRIEEFDRFFYVTYNNGITIKLDACVYNDVVKISSPEYQKALSNPNNIFINDKLIYGEKITGISTIKKTLTTGWFSKQIYTSFYFTVYYKDDEVTIENEDLNVICDQRDTLLQLFFKLHYNNDNF